MTLDVNLQHYYARRASEYDKIFAKPERQQDLVSLRTLLRKQFAGRDVLEVACGTGYWTQHIAPVANFVLATDTAAETLELARSKDLPRGKVEFAIADAFEPVGFVGLDVLAIRDLLVQRIDFV